MNSQRSAVQCSEERQITERKDQLEKSRKISAIFRSKRSSNLLANFAIALHQSAQLHFNPMRNIFLASQHDVNKLSVHLFNGGYSIKSNVCMNELSVKCKLHAHRHGTALLTTVSNRRIRFFVSIVHSTSRLDS